MHEVHAELFTVTDDVDAGIFLGAQPLERGPLFAALQRFAGQAPGGPQPFRLGEPVWFGETSNGGGSKHPRIVATTPESAWRGHGAGRLADSALDIAPGSGFRSPCEAGFHLPRVPWTQSIGILACSLSVAAVPGEMAKQNLQFGIRTESTAITVPLAAS